MSLSIVPVLVQRSLTADVRDENHHKRPLRSCDDGNDRESCASPTVIDSRREGRENTARGRCFKAMRQAFEVAAFVR